MVRDTGRSRIGCRGRFFFHQDGWMGGYGSFQRRMIRLGHISFFGLGILNVLFAFTAAHLNSVSWYIHIASYGFISGMVTMPLCCFLTAWRESFRRLFPVPVVCVLAGIIFLFIERYRP
jgi:hypothetical protein